ncbi:MAG: hypothetical protein MUP80_10175 [Acidobacteriia bacterium]|nr:hypothetical protein [Terriglobia bacterium]
MHKQLAELWRRHPFLNERMETQIVDPGSTSISWVQLAAKNFERCGYRFLPLIGRDFGIACSLDILFLRRDDPGNLVRSGGDIDNRIKVLFDALRMPETGDELPTEYKQPAVDEDPFYCLLENDNLITEVRVTTDRLLKSVEPSGSENDVHLVIHVRTLVVGASGFTAFLT